MRELGIDLNEVAGLFAINQGCEYVWVTLSGDASATLRDILSVALRRCYVSDEAVRKGVATHGRAAAEVVEARLPDRGSTMAGDFGEILTALYLAASENPVEVLDPKKWRLKVARNQPAPFSDVVQFQIPDWPASSAKDKIVCAEVKTKSTAGDSTPIESALEDAEKDRVSRLAKTLLWLRERALTEQLGTVQLEVIERFINAAEHPECAWSFHAVAVLCSSLLDSEVDGVTPPDDDMVLIIIDVADLKAAYEGAYESVTVDDLVEASP